MLNSARGVFALAEVSVTSIAQRRTALIVDHDADTRTLYTLVLRDLFDSVDEAADGAEALARALQIPPALVVTELRLPRVDGVALCALMRTHPPAPDLRIMVVTSAGDALSVSRALAAGADVVLPKPVSPEVVRSEAARLIAEPREKGKLPTSAAAGAAQHDGARWRLVDAPSHRRRQSRAHLRERTTTPPLAPPILRCPRCDDVLMYHYSYVGGVSPRFPEQWDYFECARCGAFQYRHRTRRLRQSA